MRDFMLANTDGVALFTLYDCTTLRVAECLLNVLPISLFVDILLCSIFDRCDSPLNEFDVKSGTFISEHRNDHHIRSRSPPAIACFLVLMSNLERLSANRVQFTELDASFRKYCRVIFFHVA